MYINKLPHILKNMCRYLLGLKKKQTFVLFLNTCTCMPLFQHKNIPAAGPAMIDPRAIIKER